MSSVFLLIPLGVALTVVAGVALLWAVNSGQFEDLEDAGRVVLEPDVALTPAPDRPRDP